MIEDEFKTYTHAGPYPELMKACMTIGRQHPNLTEFYCIYLNSPLEVPKDNLQAKIVFK